MKNHPIITELGSDFYSEVTPAQFPKCIPRYYNDLLVANLNMSNDRGLFKKHFWAFEPIPMNIPVPLALKYHGHQFRHYNPDLGDGRGFLFAQIEDTKKRIIDLGTKGSGQTPYSRFGDGRLTLKGALRETLATELLTSYGVDTSQTLCFFETGESLERNDEPSPTRSAVLTRASHSHIRFGSFQMLAFQNKSDSLKKLISYTVKHYYPHLLQLAATHSSKEAELLFSEVTIKIARLCSHWMIGGFVHGVLNTDNMNINGESFDYGPYRFLPEYNTDFTAAYFDKHGLYSYGRQPTACLWNLTQLGNSFKFAYPDLDLNKILGQFQNIFYNHCLENFLIKLNLKSNNRQKSEELFKSFFSYLENNQALFEKSFFDLTPKDASQNVGSSDFADLLKLRDQFEIRNPNLVKHPYFLNKGPCTLLYPEIEKIWAAIDLDDDWSLFSQKIGDIQRFRGIYSFV